MEAAAEQLRLAPARILVVDDDRFQRALLAAALMHCGATEVIQAAHGASALEALSAPGPRFDIVLTDLKMAGMDGLDFMLRAVHCEVSAFVLMSAVDAELLTAAQAVARSHGVPLLGTLGKPVTLPALQEVLARYQGGAGRRQPVPASLSRRPWRRQELLRALVKKQFVPFFQPKVDLETDRVDGVEILARWIHPSLGVLEPAHFVETMEEQGLIGCLTDSMLRQSLVCARAWSEAGFRLDMALNVAPQTLQDTGLANRLLEEVERHGMAPGRITIEVTETGVTDDPRSVLETVTRLRMHGFKISIDDFGIGRSTLMQLSEMPFTELKIDRFFVSGLPSPRKALSILESIMQMADKLGLSTVAEGIETEAERDFLRSLGCTSGQGYLFSQPLAHAELMAWMAARAGRAQQGPG
jgi:EAL domain-containing protein (putative c-di-GMP-specific phosphodiesterase class I)/CheY-like chemotaxis protein